MFTHVCTFYPRSTLLAYVRSIFTFELRSDNLLTNENDDYDNDDETQRMFSEHKTYTLVYFCNMEVTFKAGYQRVSSSAPSLFDICCRVDCLPPLRDITDSVTIRCCSGVEVRRWACDQ